MYVRRIGDKGDEYVFVAGGIKEVDHVSGFMVFEPFLYSGEICL